MVMNMSSSMLNSPSYSLKLNDADTVHGDNLLSTSFMELISYSIELTDTNNTNGYDHVIISCMKLILMFFKTH